MNNSLKKKLKLTALAAFIVALLSCTVIAFTGLGFGANAQTAKAETASEQDGGVSAYSQEDLVTEWNNAVLTSSSTNQVVVTLNENWTADSTTHAFGDGEGFSNGRLYVPAGANVKLDLNGYTIDRGLTSLTTNGNVIFVKGALEIDDTSSGQNGKITGGYCNNEVEDLDLGLPSHGIAVSGGQLVLTGGSLNGRFTFDMADLENVDDLGQIIVDDDLAAMGSVYVAGGSFKMTGGTIAHNAGVAGVAIGDSTFEMTGGTITDNFGYFGGVYVAGDSTFEMSGGKISNNLTMGGAVLLDGSSFIMHKGEISNNFTGNSGCVEIESGSTFTMHSGTISNNSGSYGGVRLDSSSCTFIMNDGAIIGNKGNNRGGGVCADHGTFEMHGGIISNNESIDTYGGEGGGIYRGSDCTFKMTGGTVTDNTARNGGGIYSYITPYDTGAMIMSGGEISGNTSLGGGDDFAFYGYSSDTSAPFWTEAINFSLAHQEKPVAVIMSSWSANSTTHSFGEGTGFSNGRLHIPVDANIQLIFRGYDCYINRGLTSGSSDGSVFLVEGTLEIIDFSSKTAKITGGYAYDGGGIYVDGGTLILDGGNITGNYAISAAGGGVCVSNNGTFIMNGGKISGNNATSAHYGGGGVAVYGGGTFEMNGGEISDNRGDYGVYCYYNPSDFTMNGGIISGNNGGVGNVGGESTFTMNGGEISGNSSTNLCGVNNYGTFIMNGGKISGHATSSSYVGGGVVNYGTFEMYGGEISGNTASQGHGVYLAGGTFTMYDGAITNNEGYQVVYINNGTFTMNGGEISDNGYDDYYAASLGCIDLNGTNAKFIMNDGTISGNTGTYVGGAISITKGAFTMNGGTISGNRAQSAAGVYVTSNGTFTMTNGTISGNHAETGSGGGVYADGTFTMTDGIISDNTARYSGGGIYLYSGTYQISGGEIINNTAEDGAGIYKVGSSGTLTITGGTISGNIATGYGGGIWTHDYNGSTLKLQGGTITGNTAKYGGGMYNNGASTFTMTAGDVSGNTATSFGNDICFEGYSATWAKAVNASLLTGNQVAFMNTGMSTDSSKSFGTSTGFSEGRLHVPEGANIILDLKGNTINRGLMEGVSTGNVFYVEGTLEVVDTSTGKTGKITGGNANSGGGAVMINNGTFILTSGKITGNTSGGGGNVGGAVMINNGTFIMNGGEISDNPCATMAHYEAGAVISYGGTFEMNGGIIKGHSATTIYLQNSTEFTMTGGSISDNTADGVYLDNSSSTFTMTGGTISGNKNGVYASCVVNMSGGTISGNTIGFSGYGTLNMSGGTISGNTGGGVYGSGTIIMDGGEISGNNTSGDGAGVYLSGSSAQFIMNGGEISGNTAGDEGGGIYVRSGKFTMNGGTISGNRALLGGGVYIYTGGTFEMNGGRIYDNTSTSNGGGVLLNGAFTMDGGEILSNTASKYGGGVYMASGTFTLKNGEISDNKAVDNTNGYGGGVFLSNGTFTMDDGIISGNTTSSGSYGGGGVFVGGGTFTMNAGKITGNTATSDGGGVQIGRGTFKLGGGTITGNTANGLANNVYLSDTKITVTGSLLKNGVASRVGVTMATNGTFTTNYTNSGNGSYAPATFFVSDGSYAISLSSGEAVLGTTTVTMTTVTWQISADNGSTWSTLESLSPSIYYTGATYRIRVLNGSTVLNSNVAITSTSTINSTVSGAGNYTFVYSGSNITNPTLNLEIKPVELTWQYSLDGGTNWVNFTNLTGGGGFAKILRATEQYNGLTWQVRAYDAINENVVAFNGQPSGEVKNAGTYEWYVGYTVNEKNYYNAVFQLTLTGLELEIEWNFTGATLDGETYYWIYDGLAHSPVPVIKNAPNDKIGNIDLKYEFESNGSIYTYAKDGVGEYLLTISLVEEDSNITFLNDSVSFSIRPKTLTLTWKDLTDNKLEVDYDGEEHEVDAILNGLVSKDYAQAYVISYYINNSLMSSAPTNVGSYTAKATLPANCINYVLDKEYVCEIVINVKTITVQWTGNAANDGEFVWTFDGTAKAPTASVADPVSGNGMTISITYAKVTGGAAGAFTSTKPVNAGNYVMRVALSVASDKYVLEDTEREFEIEKVGVTLTWKYDGTLGNGKVRWEYDGQSHNVIPEIKGVQVTKDGTFGVDLSVVRTDSASALTNVGSAKATAALDSSDSFNANFYIINATSINYEVYKRVITSATWTDKDGKTFALGSSAAYDFGDVNGTNGPDFTAVAVGADGDLTLTVIYSDSYPGDWPVDATNGYKAYATLSAADAANYCFADGSDTMSITFVIRAISGSKENIDVTWVIFTDATNYLTLEQFIAANGGEKFFFTYNGTAQAPTALYIKSDGSYEVIAISDNSKGTDAGEYTARILPSDIYNIQAEQATCDFEIKPRDITIVWQNAVDDSEQTYTYNYDGNPHAPYATVMGNGSVPCAVEVASEINADNYTATALVSGNFNVVSGLTQEFTIKQMELNTSLISWSATGAEERHNSDGSSYFVWVYDGLEHAPEASITIARLDLTLELSVLGATSEVGTSYALAMLDGSNETNANFKLIGTAQQRFEIVRVPAGTVIWEDGEGHTSIDGNAVLYLTYNGTVQAPAAYFMNGDTKVTLSVLGAMTDAGTYTAWVTGDFDFGGKTPECEYTIVAKKLNVEWSETTVTFSGSALSPVATVVDEELGYTLVKGTDYTVDEFVNVNGYSAEIHFINKNYTYEGETNKTAFTINKLDLSDVASWSFDGAVTGEDGIYKVQYNAQTHAPEIAVDGYTLDGEAVTFVFTYTGAVANIGDHTVTATIASAMWNGNDISANLTLGEKGSKDYKITPFEITVIWDFDDAEQDGDGYFWYYDTNEHAPKAYFTDWAGETKELTVYGAAVNARATAYSASVIAPANCTIAGADNATATFLIKQATINVEWSAEGDYKLVDGVYVWIYDGDAHAPKAVISGTTNVLPVLGQETDAGEYVATAAQNDGNYVILSGATQSFKIEALTVYIKWYGVDGSEENFKWPYSGKDQAPTAKLVNAAGEPILDKDGNEIEVEVAGASLSVGGHTAVATNTFRNYVFAPGAKTEQPFNVIAKTLEGFEWIKGGATVTVEDGMTVYTYLYTGENLQPVPTSSFGNDLAFKVTIIDTKTNKEVQAITEAGTYTVTAASLNENFAVPADKATLKIVVNPFEAEVVWSEEAIFYNGVKQKPTAHFIDANGNQVDLNVTVEESDYAAAGTYTATASFKTASPNYVLTKATTIFEIEKVKLHVEWKWTGWTDKTYTYDGGEHAPVPEVKATTALNLTVSYTVYDKDGNPVPDNKVVNAGEYKIKLTLGGDGAENYTFDSDEETFKIGKKAITITVNSLSIDYGADAPEYTATVSGLVEAEEEALLEVIMAQKSKWLRCEYVARYAPGDYDIGVVKSVLAGLLKNYEVPEATGTLTVGVVPFTVVWYKAGSNQPDYNSYYNGSEYKPGAYYKDDVNGDLIPLDVVYADYNEATGEYTAKSNASPAIDAGTYYVMVVAPSGITLTNAGTSYEIFKLNITVNVNSVNGVFGDVYNSDGELIHAQLTYKFGDITPVDDLEIALALSVTDSDFDAYGYLNVGNYNVIGSWNAAAFEKNYNLEFVGEAEDGNGHNSYGIYKVENATITVTKDKETWSGEQFEEILASSNGLRQYIVLDAQEKDDNGEDQYVYIDYVGHKSIAGVNLMFSVLHNLADHEVPDPREDDFYKTNPYMAAAGRYAVNYKIEIANHETLYGTWNVLIVPADGIVTIEFVKDYQVTYGTAVPENLAEILLEGGYINVYGYNTNVFARNAVVTIPDGLGGNVSGTTGVGKYTINIEIADDDPNEIHYVRFTDESNVDRYVITPKRLTVDWGTTSFTQDKEDFEKVWIEEIGITVSGFVNAESLKLENILVSADGDYATTQFEVIDNGVTVKLTLTAWGDFKSVGGNTIVLTVEDGNYEIAVENSAAAVTIIAPEAPAPAPVKGGIPAWVWWLIGIIAFIVLILIFVIIALKRKKGGSSDDDGFYDDVDGEVQ